jgi:uncharacterized protein (DUF362 family)
MARSRVAVLKVNPETVLDDLIRLCDLAGLGQALDRGAATLLKTELASHFPVPGSNTTPWQLEGSILALEQAGLSDLSCVQNRRFFNKAFKPEDPNGYRPILERHGVVGLDLGRADDVRWVEYRPRSKLHVLHQIFPEGIWLPKYLFGQNVVHLPTLKHQPQTGMTGAMRSAVVGLFRSERRHEPGWMHRALVDVLAIQQEIHSGLFAVMDCTTVGRGPGTREPLVKNYMLASSDQVALDAVAARLLGLDPLRLEFIRLAHDVGLGIGNPADIQVVGADLSGENWGPGAVEKVTSSVFDVLSFGPLERLQKRLANSPLGHVWAAGEELYQDFYGWPHKDKAVFERWRAGTAWGRLFGAYQGGRQGPAVAGWHSRAVPSGP